MLSEHFATAQVCARCHSSSERAQGMRDAKGRSVAPFDLWRTSMMANASRDPLWRAVLSAEVQATPSRAEDIQSTCLRCHAPMASQEHRFADAPSPTLADLSGEDATALLGLDGVSCTVCHQIQAENLGTPESYSGNWVIGKEHVIYGPHPDPLTMPMRRHTGFTPTHGTQVMQPALCGSCHTLYTDALLPDGSESGHRLPEQTPYLEWRNSDFSTEGTLGKQAKTCQACHVPFVDEDGQPLETRIARNPMGGDFRIPERRPVGRHVFRGANTLVLSILRDNQETLQPQAPPEAFDRAIELARENLREHTATLTLADVARDGDTLRGSVALTNLTGHKFPTAHPTRRAWLRVRVTDASGQVVFASGEHDPDGRLLGADGQPLPAELPEGPVHAHQATIASADAPLVYEAVMGTPDGAPTYLLTRGASYIKDTRLLPQGWSAEHPDAQEILPRGTEGDADHTAGGDRVALALPVGAAQGPLTLEVELLYQTLGARYAAELFRYDTPEVREFRAYYARAERGPERVAGATLAVE
ncbi:MAG: multiheme c-type cytochrome [Planctomycetota bacterium]